MTILALEFSSPQRSVAVLQTGDAQAATEIVEAGGRNTAAFGMIEKILAETKIERGEIDVIAVGLGPGSYTGIRAAIALAQGWQLARGVKLLGVSSVEAIAAQAQAEKKFGRVNVVIDAQRNEFYLATYEISADGWREIESLKILSLAEVQLRADARDILTGPEVTRWFPDGRMIFPHAVVLAKLATDRSDFVAGETLKPIYLRETNFVKSPRCRSAVS
jgi:tRNA threonylcarbamoyladenosine biosynthesis protein TsaB